eukprot:PhM_4_TR9491/c6_g1_i1/m.25958
MCRCGFAEIGRLIVVDAPPPPLVAAKLFRAAPRPGVAPRWAISACRFSCTFFSYCRIWSLSLAFRKARSIMPSSSVRRRPSAACTHMSRCAICASRSFWVSTTSHRGHCSTFVTYEFVAVVAAAPSPPPPPRFDVGDAELCALLKSITTTRISWRARCRLPSSSGASLSTMHESRWAVMLSIVSRYDSCPMHRGHVSSRSRQSDPDAASSSSRSGAFMSRTGVIVGASTKCDVLVLLGDDLFGDGVADDVVVVGVDAAEPLPSDRLTGVHGTTSLLLVVLIACWLGVSVSSLSKEFECQAKLAA